MDRKTHINFWYVVVAMMLILLARYWWEQSRRIETIPYSEFQVLLQEGQIQEISISATHIRGKLRQAASDGHEYLKILFSASGYILVIIENAVHSNKKLEFRGNVIMMPICDKYH